MRKIKMSNGIESDWGGILAMMVKGSLLYGGDI